MNLETKNKSIYIPWQGRVEKLQDHNNNIEGRIQQGQPGIKEDLKKTHRNYLVQVQSLINQKEIEAPREKKRWWRFW